MANIKETLEKNLVIFFLSAIFMGYAAGFGSYQAILEVAKLDTVQRDAYVLKSNIVGSLIKNEALQQIEHLIEIGENIASSKKKNEAENYMLRAHTFAHYLDLPIEYEIAGNKFSFAEQTIDYIIRDIPDTGQPAHQLPDKIERIVGVLKGLKGSFSSRIK